MPDRPSVPSVPFVPSTPISIPRETWTRHPNWPQQVLLLGSHDNFRRVSRHLVECAEDREDVAFIGSLFVRWISAMRSHEAYEEHKLYPYLTKRWGVDFGRASEGHAQLHARADEVVAAVRDLVNADDANDDLHEALAAALRAHDDVLVDHLAHEEECVIPLLLQMSATEFQTYTMLPLDDLIRRLDDGRLPGR